MKGMTAEEVAILVDDVHSMANDFIVTRDRKSLENMLANIAQMIRLHLKGKDE